VCCCLRGSKLETSLCVPSELDEVVKKPRGCAFIYRQRNHGTSRVSGSEEEGRGRLDQCRVGSRNSNTYNVFKRAPIAREERVLGRFRLVARSNIYRINPWTVT
jgi:hypothetical protein